MLEMCKISLMQWKVVVKFPDPDPLLPVAEEMQMGISVGLAIDGFVPISIFPRWNFLLLGMNQLINHFSSLNIELTKENLLTFHNFENAKQF